MLVIESVGQKYQPITRINITKRPEWDLLSPELREAVLVVSQVLPFRTNNYVAEQLIDWGRLPEDPMFQLTFPQKGMLKASDYEVVRDLVTNDAPRKQLNVIAGRIHRQLNPQPAGQLTHNVPELHGRKLQGLQHKYRETVLYFPRQGQTCHAYCTYCFRWPQFVGMPDFKFQARDSSELVAYLRAHREVTDLLLTGGDPMIMKTAALRKHLDPVLTAPGLEHLRSIRIGTKALAYWPYRFLSDPDSDELLSLFERIIRNGRNLAIMAHFSHPVELGTEAVRKAISRIRSTGAQIRTQAPIIRHVNDVSSVWAEMWKKSVHLGMIPYYMFVERDTGARKYFEIPLYDAYRIFREAYSQVSGLARTVRGPSMSAFPGKVHLVGVTQVADERVFVLQFLQARRREWVRRPFFAEFDETATWFDQLKPCLGRSQFFFQREIPDPAGSRLS